MWVMTDDAGLRTVDFGLEEKLISRSMVQDAIVASASMQAEKREDVKCGQAALIRVPDAGVLWCDINHATKTSRVKVVPSENQKTGGWTIDLEVLP